ncbi:MAG TPA: M48 family metalloprotease [Longimicrobium sp.]
MDTSTLLLALIALAPGAYAWWTGRALASRADDPDLPDLLVARRRRLQPAWTVALVAVIFISGGRIGWIVPLGVGLAAGTFPLRRRLFDERWGFAGYLLWTVRTLVPALGLVLLLQLAPLLIVSARPYHWAAAAAAVLAMQAWRRWQFRLWLWAYRATPLDRPALLERFGEIVRRAGTVSPGVYRMGPKGGRLANAFALPDPRGPSVAFGDDLLELLDEDEAAAIFAHELAHIEQHDAARVRRGRMRMHGLVACAAGVPLLLIAAGWAGTVQALALGLVLLFGLARIIAHRQADETAADARAAELTGDPEAVVRALVRLHQYMRLPRRWPHEMEARASHPSLARRIAALRGGADGAGPAPRPGVLRSPREGSWVAFDERRVSWFDGVPAGTPPEPAVLHQAAATARTVAYAELADMRVSAGPGPHPVLSATDRAGVSWQLPIFAEDVEAVRERVHQVDVQFTAPAPVPTVAGRRTVALVAFFAAWWAGAAALMLPALLAMAWPATAALAALGAMALGMPAVRAAEGSLRWASGLQLAALGVLALVGVGMIAMSLGRGPRKGAPRRPGIPLAVLAVLALLAAARVWMVASDGGVDWRAGVPGAETAGLLLAGLAAGLLRLPRTALRRSGAAAAAALGIGALLLSLGGDRLAGRAPRIRWAEGRAAPAGSVSLPRFADLVAMSPSGRAWLVRQPPDDDRWQADTRWRYMVGDFSGFRRAFSASDAAFAGDGHLLVVQGGGDSAQVRMEPLSGPAPLWTHVLRGASHPTVAPDGADGWSVLAYEPGGGGRVLVTGGAAGPARTRRAGRSAGYAQAVDVGGGAMVLLHAGGFPESASLLPLLLRGGAGMHREAWRVDASGERPLGRVSGVPRCARDDARGGAVCSVTDGRRAALWSLGRDGGMVNVGQVPPDLLGDVAVHGGVVAAVRHGGEVAVIRPDARRGWRVPVPAGASAVHPVPGGVAVLYGGVDGSTLRLFRTTLPTR